MVVGVWRVVAWLSVVDSRIMGPAPILAWRALTSFVLLVDVDEGVCGLLHFRGVDGGLGHFILSALWLSSAHGGDREMSMASRLAALASTYP